MKVLIVEDEPPIADYIERCARSLLADKIEEITVLYALEDAVDYLRENDIDLCLLDLNLSGADGYDLLNQAAASPFATIIISAYSEKAVTAFEYDVIDFIPKPFNLSRLQKALEKFYRTTEKSQNPAYLTSRTGRKNFLIALDQVRYFKASRILVEAHLINGGTVLIDRHLNQLEEVLPSHFFRIHRSYIVNIGQAESFGHAGQGGYRLTLKNGHILPVSRRRIRGLREVLEI